MMMLSFRVSCGTQDCLPLYPILAGLSHRNYIIRPLHAHLAIISSHQVGVRVGQNIPQTGIRRVEERMVAATECSCEAGISH